MKFAVFRLQLVRGEQSETECIVEQVVDGAVLGLATKALGQFVFYEADASSEPGCSPHQKQPCPDNDGPDGSSDALTGRR